MLKAMISHNEQAAIVELPMDRLPWMHTMKTIRLSSKRSFWF